jgi:hypothetical protein
MKHFYTALFALVSCGLLAQNKFEKGYFIANNGVRTDCLIKDMDWNDTPVEFTYRLTENDNPVNLKNTDVKEFSVNDTKFVSREVDIDRSPDRTGILSTQKNPEFAKARVFLRLIVNGNAKLYYYRDNDLVRYFYSLNDGSFQPLIHKRYFIDHYKLDVATNNSFRQQLWTNVKCESTKMNDVEKLNYNHADLEKYFETVNGCNGSKVTEVKAKAKKGSFNIKASVMLGMHGFTVEGPLASHDFGSKSYVAFGAEAEYILPFWNNKWALMVEPSFNSFKKTDISTEEGLDLQYKYIDITAGFRHYFFLNDNAKIFLNAGLDYAEISGSSKITFEDPSPDYNDLEFGDNSLTLAFGTGFNYSRFSVEFRLHSKGNPSPYNTINYGYSNYALITRYQFL